MYETISDEKDSFPITNSMFIWKIMNNCNFFSNNKNFNTIRPDSTSRERNKKKRKRYPDSAAN